LKYNKAELVAEIINNGENNHEQIVPVIPVQEQDNVVQKLPCLTTALTQINAETIRKAKQAKRLASHQKSVDRNYYKLAVEFNAQPASIGSDLF